MVNDNELAWLLSDVDMIEAAINVCSEVLNYCWRFNILNVLDD